MERTLNNCLLIRGNRSTLGTPEVHDGKCLGYAGLDTSDEPCSVCKNCKLCTSYSEEEADEAVDDMLGTGIHYMLSVNNGSVTVLNMDSVGITGPRHYDFFGVPIEIILLHYVVLASKAWLEGRKLETGKEFYSWEATPGARMTGIIQGALDMLEHKTGDSLNIKSALEMLFEILDCGGEISLGLLKKNRNRAVLASLSELIVKHLNEETLRLVECVVNYCKVEAFNVEKCLKLLDV